MEKVFDAMNAVGNVIRLTRMVSFEVLRKTNDDIVPVSDRRLNRLINFDFREGDVAPKPLFEAAFRQMFFYGSCLMQKIPTQRYTIESFGNSGKNMFYRDGYIAGLTVVPHTLESHPLAIFKENEIIRIDLHGKHMFPMMLHRLVEYYKNPFNIDNVSSITGIPYELIFDEYPYLTESRKRSLIHQVLTYIVLPKATLFSSVLENHLGLTPDMDLRLKPFSESVDWLKVWEGDYETQT